MLSTLKTSTEISEEVHQKPIAILKYNNTKFGVDTVEQLAHAKGKTISKKNFITSYFFSI